MSKLGSFVAHLYKGATQQHHKEMIPIFRTFISETSTVIDVGGHAGQFAKLFSRMAPKGTVVTFEPATYARSVLRTSIFTNRLRNITVIPAGLADKCGCAVLNIPLKKGRSIGYGLSHMGTPNTHYETISEVVPIITLDDFVKSSDMKMIDFIKIDIEGWELRMIKGAEGTIIKFMPPILVELVDSHLARAGDSLHAAWEYMMSLGYRPWVQNETGTLVALEDIREGDIWWLPSKPRPSH